MALTLTKEDGTGKADANSYASVADGDAYHEGHLYATAWTGSTTANKEKALVFATRLIDAEWRFRGAKLSGAQSLQWPRSDCPDLDAAGRRSSPLLGGWRNGMLPSDAVPSAVVQATCEQARELILLDRTANPLGEGLLSSKLGDTAQTFDKTDRRPILSRLVQSLLTKLGSSVHGATVSLRRV